MYSEEMRFRDNEMRELNREFKRRQEERQREED
jgi:hypothetical protein